MAEQVPPAGPLKKVGLRIIRTLETHHWFVSNQILMNKISQSYPILLKFRLIIELERVAIRLVLFPFDFSLTCFR